MSGGNGSSFPPPPGFPPPTPPDDSFTPHPIISEPTPFFKRRVAKLPVWAWTIVVVIALLGIVVAAATANDDPEEVESAGPSTQAATSTAVPTSSPPETTAPATSQAPTTAPATTTAATTAPAPVTTAMPITAPPSTIPPASTAPPSAPPETPPPLPGFGTGIQLVGADVEPGRYVANEFDFCYWERLSGFSGELDDVIVNDIPNQRAIVEILPTDAAFDSVDCGDWTLYLPTVTLASFSDGDWVVGQDIAPGRYTADGGQGSCYWERASGFTHDFEELIANDIPSGRAIAEILPSDVRFSSKDCGTWTPL